jgi:hypothetical protein
MVTVTFTVEKCRAVSIPHIGENIKVKAILPLCDRTRFNKRGYGYRVTAL